MCGEGDTSGSKRSERGARESEWSAGDEESKSGERRCQGTEKMPAARLPTLKAIRESTSSSVPSSVSSSRGLSCASACISRATCHRCWATRRGL